MFVNRLVACKSMYFGTQNERQRKEWMEAFKHGKQLVYIAERQY